MSTWRRYCGEPRNRVSKDDESERLSFILSQKLKLESIEYIDHFPTVYTNVKQQNVLPPHCSSALTLCHNTYLKYLMFCSKATDDTRFEIITTELIVNIALRIFGCVKCRPVVLIELQASFDAERADLASR